jgi:hypothetical protein
LENKYGRKRGVKVDRNGRTAVGKCFNVKEREGGKGSGMIQGRKYYIKEIKKECYFPVIFAGLV